jgi:hypothetical protein
MRGNLEPYGSHQIHRKYQEHLQIWFQNRNQQPSKPNADDELSEKLSQFTTNSLREKRLAGSPITINELVMVRRRFTK